VGGDLSLVQTFHKTFIEILVLTSRLLLPSVAMTTSISSHVKDKQWYLTARKELFRNRILGTRNNFKEL